MVYKFFNEELRMSPLSAVCMVVLGFAVFIGGGCILMAIPEDAVLVAETVALDGILCYIGYWIGKNIWQCITDNNASERRISSPKIILAVFSAFMIVDVFAIVIRWSGDWHSVIGHHAFIPVLLTAVGAYRMARNEPSDDPIGRNRWGALCLAIGMFLFFTALMPCLYLDFSPEATVAWMIICCIADGFALGSLFYFLFGQTKETKEDEEKRTYVNSSEASEVNCDDLSDEEEKFRRHWFYVHDELLSIDEAKEQLANSEDIGEFDEITEMSKYVLRNMDEEDLCAFQGLPRLADDPIIQKSIFSKWLSTLPAESRESITPQNITPAQFIMLRDWALKNAASAYRYLCGMTRNIVRRN